MPFITEALTPKNAGAFATHDEEFARGGFRAVADPTARDAIPLDRRTEGMQVYVVSQDLTYRKGTPLASDGGTWVLLSGGGPIADPNARPFTEPVSQPTTIFVETTGNDNNDGLTLPTALATLQEAQRRIATANDGNVTIQLGAGVFTAPGMTPLGNFLTYVGTESDGAALTIMGVITATDALGLCIDFSGVALSAVDAHRGVLVEFTSGAASGVRCRVYRSDASIGADTRFYMTHDGPTSTPIPGPLDTAKIVNLDTSINYTSVGSITTSVLLNFQRLRLTGSQLLFFNVTDKVEYKYCDIELINPVMGRFGAAFFWGCYFKCSGNDNNGMLGVVNSGFCQLERGTVIDASFTGTAVSRRFVKVSGGSRMSIKGMVAMRGLNAGLLITNSDLIADDPSNATHNLHFENGNGTSAPSNANGIIYDGAVTQGLLPHLFGEVASTYAVVTNAQACACVRLPTASTIITSSVPKAVSADGGGSAVSEHLQSVIYGGTPDARRIIPQSDGAGTVGESGRRWGFGHFREMVTGDLVMRAIDNSAEYRFIEKPNGLIVVVDEKTGKKYRLPLIPLEESTP